MAGDMRISVTVSAIDQLTAPMKAMAASLGGVETKLRETAKVNEDFKAKWHESIKAVEGVGRAMAAVSVVGDAGLGMMVKGAAEAGSQMLIMAQRTGMAVESLSALKFAAERSGVNFEGLELAMRRMSKSAVEMETAIKKHGGALQSIDPEVQETSKGYARLGVSVLDAGGKLKDQGTLFVEVAEKIRAMPDPMERSAAAMQIFGRAGTDMLPLLMKGREGIAQLTQQANDMGLTMSTEGAESAHEFEISLNVLESTLVKLRNTLGASLMEVLKPIIERIQEVLTSVLQWVKANPDLARTILTVVAAVGSIGAAIAPILIMLPSLVSDMSLFWVALSSPAGPAAIAIMAVAIAIGAMAQKTSEAIAAAKEGAAGGKYDTSMIDARKQEKLLADAANAEKNRAGATAAEIAKAEKDAIDATILRLKMQEEHVRRLERSYRNMALVAAVAFDVDSVRKLNDEADRMQTALGPIQEKLAKAQEDSKRLGTLVGPEATAAPIAAVPLTKPQTDYNEALKAEGEARTALADAATEADEKIAKADQTRTDALDAQAKANEENIKRIRMARRSLADAEEAEADNAEQVKRRIEAAQEALTDAEVSGSERVVSAVEAVANARAAAADDITKAQNAETDAAKKNALAHEAAAEKIADAYRSTGEKVAAAQERLRSVMERMQEFVATGGGQRQLTKQERLAKEWRDLTRDAYKAQQDLQAAETNRPDAIVKAKVDAARHITDTANSGSDSVTAAWKAADNAGEAVNKALKAEDDARDAKTKNLAKAELALADAREQGEKSIAKAKRSTDDAREALNEAFVSVAESQKSTAKAVREASDALTQAQLAGADAVRAATEKANEAIDKLNAAIGVIQPGATGHTGMPYVDQTLASGPVPHVTLPALQGAMAAVQAARANAGASGGWQDYGITPPMAPIMAPSIPNMQTMGAGANGGSMRIDIALDDGLVARQTGQYLQTPDGRQIVVGIVQGYGARQAGGGSSSY